MLTRFFQDSDFIFVLQTGFGSGSGFLPEMITIRFAGWISGRIVSLQPDADIQKLLSNGNRIRIRISETLLAIFLGFRLLEKLRIVQSFIYYLQKHLFYLLCHDFQFDYGVISAA